MKMKVKEFIKQDIDIDVYDNVCEELGVAFCGPMYLTKEGKKRFSDVLEFDIDIDFENDVAIVDVDGDDDVWEKQLEEAETFFNAMAGYCSVTDYGKWFEN